MVAQIGEYITAGELRNIRHNTVFGWIEFAPGFGVRIELTGNMSDRLAGKHIRFRTARATQPPTEQLPELIANLADRQIGVVDRMQLKNVDGPESSSAPSGDDDGPAVCGLHLAWFSQDGPIVANVMASEFEWIEQDEISSDNGDNADGDSIGAGFTEYTFDDEDGGSDDDEDSGEEDPFGLFDEDLEKNLANSLGHASDSDHPGSEATLGDLTAGRDELDPETAEMYAQWDEIFQGTKDEPIGSLFETPLRLPLADKVTSEQEAENYVKLILAQLARLSVALDVCEHFSAMDTYRVLVQDILPNAKVHPNLAASDMVQHYSTSDYCAACEAEYDADYDGSPEATNDDGVDGLDSDDLDHDESE